MTWITELLKNLTLSRSTTGALFVATLALLVLPSVVPKYVPAVPSQWQWLVVGLCIFSAALLSFWAVKGLASASRKLPSHLRAWLPAPSLPELEVGILVRMGSSDPNAQFDLNYTDHRKISKLSLLQACRHLEKYGYLRYVLFQSDVFVLTNRGIDKAHEILRSQET